MIAPTRMITSLSLVVLCLCHRPRHFIEPTAIFLVILRNNHRIQSSHLDSDLPWLFDVNRLCFRNCLFEIKADFSVTTPSPRKWPWQQRRAFRNPLGYQKTIKTLYLEETTDSFLPGKKVLNSLPRHDDSVNLNRSSKIRNKEIPPFSVLLCENSALAFPMRYLLRLLEKEVRPVTTTVFLRVPLGKPS